MSNYCRSHRQSADRLEVMEETVERQKTNENIKGKVYGTVVRPVMYGAETLAVEEAREKIIGGRRKCYDGCAELQSSRG